jgi:hypothetical protein
MNYLNQIEFDFTQQSFYDTVGLNEKELAKAELSAKSLEGFIVINLKPDVEYSPYDVLELCKKLDYPTKENSVRRALSNLKDKYKKIVLTGNKIVNSNYSRVPNHTIKLA